MLRAGREKLGKGAFRYLKRGRKREEKLAGFEVRAGGNTSTACGSSDDYAKHKKKREPGFPSRSTRMGKRGDKLPCIRGQEGRAQRGRLCVRGAKEKAKGIC